MKSSPRGFSLLEMLVYIALLSLITIAMVDALIPLSRSFATLRATQDIHAAAGTSLERMIRDVRASGSINAASTFDVNPGGLTLISGATTTEFFLQNSVLMLKQNGVLVGPLSNRKNVTVEIFVFRLLSNPVSEGVRIELTLKAKRGSFVKTETFYAFAILRGTYQE